MELALCWNKKKKGLPQIVAVVESTQMFKIVLCSIKSALPQKQLNSLIWRGIYLRYLMYSVYINALHTTARIKIQPATGLHKACSNGRSSAAVL